MNAITPFIRLHFLVNSFCLYLSFRVPLLISHPKSPFHGQHYSEPVELIDIFPTLLDLFPVSPTNKPCQELASDMNVCLPLQGKSLAPVVLGTTVGDPLAPSATYPGVKDLAKKKERQKKKHAGVMIAPSTSVIHRMPSLGKDLFAVSQSWRCVLKKQLLRITPVPVNGSKLPEKRGGFNPWFECSRGDNRKPFKRDEQVSVMGYSFRDATARYTIWLHWDRVKNLPQLSVPPFAEELYDHRGETLQNFTHLEMVNVVHKPEFADMARRLKARAIRFLERDVKFKGPYNES